MNSFTRPALAAATVVIAITALAGCSGGGGGGGEATTAPEFVDGATFTFAMSSDPGALDPQKSAVSALFQLTQFAYDTLVSIDKEGEVGPQLAKDFNVDGTTVTLTLNEGITCSDGSAFTADTAAANIAWVADPNNQSPFLGTFIPVGVTAQAEGATLTLTLATPSPFVLQSLANLPMVCDSGLEDRDALSAATAGTGPYTLTEAVPNDHYSYELRDDYAWGPNGITSEENGLPSTVVARIIPNETTAANLLLSGDVNAATVLGPDAQRLEAQELFSAALTTVIGEQWFNQADGHVTSDPAVRMALTQALDLAELQKVITSGTGVPATRLTVMEPSSCVYDAASGSVPGTDVDAAAKALDDAGWVVGSDGIREKDGAKLELTFLYNSALGAGGTSAAELATKAWEAIGVKIDGASQDSSTMSGALFGTGAWDIAWISVNIGSPDQIVPFVSGVPAPDGTNFAGIDNADYNAGVAEAMAMNGTEGCDTWKAAEEALFRAADVVPFANGVVPTYAMNAQFEMAGSITPTSIRMLASN